MHKPSVSLWSEICFLPEITLAPFSWRVDGSLVVWDGAEE